MIFPISKHYPINIILENRTLGGMAPSRRKNDKHIFYFLFCDEKPINLWESIKILYLICDLRETSMFIFKAIKNSINKYYDIFCTINRGLFEVEFDLQIIATIEDLK